MDIKKILEQYIVDELLMGQHQGEIQPDTSLIGSGILDSLSLIRLINFIEDRFKVTIEDEEVIPDNFETVNELEKLISGKDQSR